MKKQRIRRSPIKRKKRSAAEDERVYGPAEFRDWLHSLPCVVTGLTGNIVQAHVRGDGMARKADYRWSVPMDYFVHEELHRIGIETFQRKYCIDLILAAETTFAVWQLRSA